LLQIAGSSQQRLFPCYKLQEALNNVFFLAANCRRRSTTSFSLLQIAGNAQQRLFPCYKLQEALNNVFFLAVNCEIEKHVLKPQRH
jgi:glycyl-tRNA synthetase beta subunit